LLWICEEGRLEAFLSADRPDIESQTAVPGKMTLKRALELAPTEPEPAPVRKQSPDRPAGYDGYEVPAPPAKPLELIWYGQITIDRIEELGNLRTWNPRTVKSILYRTMFK
jgi:hypothetical protein